MVINGSNRLACKVLLKNVGRRITVEPMRGFPVIKDLLVDMESFLAKYRSVKPYLITYTPEPEKERLQSPEDRERFDDTTKCILCGACTTSCPSFWANEDYVGPAAIGGGETANPEFSGWSLALPDRVQLRRGLPTRHQRDPRHRRSEKGFDVAETVTYKLEIRKPKSEPTVPSKKSVEEVSPRRGRRHVAHGNRTCEGFENLSC
jgi:hypothetical protein